MYHAETLTDYDAVRALIPAWRDLLTDCDANEFTLTPEWVLTWWEVFGSGKGLPRLRGAMRSGGRRRLRVIAIRQGERLVGLAPLLTRRHWYLRLLPFRRVESLGSGEPRRESICSDYLNILARRGHEAEVARTVLQQIGDCEELILPLMGGHGPMPQLLLDAGRTLGWSGTSTETTRSPYISLPSTWEAYLKQLSRKERYLINRSLRDFESWAGADWQLHEATPSTLSEGTKILHSLHQERWQGSGVFRSTLFQAFHARVMPLLQERDALELLWLTVRGKPIAAMYNVRWNRKTSFYQCGRATDVPRGIRPGGILLYFAIRRAIESGQREFDLLGGESPYKRQVTLESRPLVTIRLARKTRKEQVREWAERSKDRLRPWWRRRNELPLLEAFQRSLGSAWTWTSSSMRVSSKQSTARANGPVICAVGTPAMREEMLRIEGQ